MADNNFLLPVLLLKKMGETSAHTEILICQGVVLSGSRRGVEEDCED